MNYFGLFFTFMIPGVLIGIMAAAVLREVASAKLRQVARRRKYAAHERYLAEQRAAQNARLFVHDLGSSKVPPQRNLSREVSKPSAA